MSTAYEITLAAVCEGRLAVACPGVDEDGDPVVRVLYTGPLGKTERAWTRARTPRIRSIVIASFAFQAACASARARRRASS